MCEFENLRDSAVHKYTHFSVYVDAEAKILKDVELDDEGNEEIINSNLEYLLDAFEFNSLSEIQTQEDLDEIMHFIDDDLAQQRLEAKSWE